VICRHISKRVDVTLPHTGYCTNLGDADLRRITKLSFVPCCWSKNYYNIMRKSKHCHR
jgi:hypothetical protein